MMGTRIVIFCFLLLGIIRIPYANAQHANGIPYQTVITDGAGKPIQNKPAYFKFSIANDTSFTSPLWEETIVSYTDANGLAYCIIGTGVSTGTGSLPSFSQIDWGNGIYYLRIALDMNATGSYMLVGQRQLLSNIYAQNANYTDAVTNLYLHQLTDVNVAGLLKDRLLKWNGNFWTPADDLHKDTVSFAFNSGNSKGTHLAGYAFTTDFTDTALVSGKADTTRYTDFSLISENANHAHHADTALYAYTGKTPNWQIAGNSAIATGNFLGTVDAQDLIFKTNNVARINMKVDGRMESGNVVNPASFSLSGNEGVLAEGTFDSGTIPSADPGTKMMWYPKKAAFRVGSVSGNQWDDINIGPYSLASGYNCIAAGNCAFASGNECTADGTYAVAIGYKSQASGQGTYPGGTSVAIGDSNVVKTLRSVAIGTGNYIDIIGGGNTGIAIGKNNKVTGTQSVVIGTNCIASGRFATVLGYNASANAKNGGFIFADASSQLTNQLAHFQFMVKASGGTVFYTDPQNTMGVMLPAGGGSWTSVSDREKKENFSVVDEQEILKKIEKLSIKSWNYKTQQEAIKHIGPLAQDFYRLFQIGEDKRMISTADMDGVILAGVKGLYARINNASALTEITELSKRLSSLDTLKDLHSRLDAIEKQLQDNK